ncbi:MFS transporter [Streptomyces sp. NPDC006334]|uniref:MFS transporter n=1 Tax=Streptomyces sp. NPDC006334 TaxID=3156754 RepID=UPI0033AA7C23
MAVLLPSFMTALDNTIVNVALPAIQAELVLTDADLKWVAAVYPLTLASFLLLGGHLADIVGRRATLLLGVALFSVSSAGGTVAASGEVLIALRGLQGAGAALILPASLAVMAQDLPARSRNVAFSAMTATLATALACGPVVSGVMTQHLGWESVFAMNVPLGCVSLLFGCAVPRRAPFGRSPSARTVTLSLRVVALACCALAALAHWLIEGAAYGFTGIPVVVSGTVFAASAVGLSYELTLRRNAALRLLFRQRPYLGGVITQLLGGLRKPHSPTPAAMLLVANKRCYKLLQQTLRGRRLLPKEQARFALRLTDGVAGAGPSVVASDDLVAVRRERRQVHRRTRRTSPPFRFDDLRATRLSVIDVF